VLCATVARARAVVKPLLEGLWCGSAARRLPGPDAPSIAHGGDPNVEQKGEPETGNPEETGHGYDCHMPSRRDADRIKTEMEELFADLCQARLGGPRKGFRPRVDVFRTENPPALNLVVELAGVDPADLELSVVEGVLLLARRRHRGSGVEDETRRYHHMEIDYGSFERRILLGDVVDADSARASYERGFLTVVFPLAERTSGPVRLKVTTGGRE
jgi:HSP20 family protein